MRATTLKTLAAAALVAAAAAAQAPLRLQSSGESAVTVTGTSTLHAWTLRGDRIAGAIEIAPAFLDDPSLAAVPSLRGAGGAPLVRVTIPVAALRSGEGERMDKVVRQALKSDAHPEVRYELERALLQVGTDPAAGPFALDTRGKLTVAGVTRPVTMPVQVTRAPSREVTVQGKVALKMTDFGIQPPRALMGTIRSGDDVTVSFRWTVR
jgi:YceI-like domain